MGGRGQKFKEKKAQVSLVAKEGHQAADLRYEGKEICNSPKEQYTPAEANQ